MRCRRASSVFIWALLLTTFNRCGQSFTLSTKNYDKSSSRYSIHHQRILSLSSSSSGIEQNPSIGLGMSTSSTTTTNPITSIIQQQFLSYLNDSKLIDYIYPSIIKDDIIYLMTEDSSIDETARKKCKYDVYISSDSSKWSTSKEQLNLLIDKIQSDSAISEEDTLLDAGEWSHFVSLTYPSIETAAPFLPEIRIGADAWELRVDLLEDMSPISLHRQISLLRSISPLPIVFTVRSVGQIGKFPPNPDKIFALLHEGVRAGAEWIDIEACWPQSYIHALTSLIRNKYNKTSRILGSLHVTTPQTKDQITELYEQCKLSGAADMVKVVTGASNDDDCRLVHTCGAATGLPYIGLCLGAAGSLSRVLNRRLTPVTHALMAAAAPGQLSAVQLMNQRQNLGLISPRKYYLFGTPIKQSMSPAMHNAAYNALLLPHAYYLSENDTVESYESILKDGTFGGASVTIPHKETIGRFLDEVSPEAEAIGAINTIVKIDGKLVGYNTDWLGMKVPISRLLKSTHSRPKGLVIGAGGTAKAACFAVNALGLQVIVHNRSPAKGIELACKFNGSFLSDLSTVNGEDIAVVISTVPASAAFTLPENILKAKPIILDVVYKPVRTPLIQQALDAHCPCIQGATMLLEQGIQQFQFWNKRRAPRSEMDSAVFNGIEKIF